MQKLYFVLCRGFERCQYFSVQKHLRLWMWIVLPLIITAALPVRAQEATFFEDFENVPKGEMPQGWTFYQHGGTDPTARWKAIQYFGFGTRFLSSLSEFGTGEKDEDWAITPPIPVADGDHLIFDGSQDTWTSFGDMYYVFISTTTADAPDAFEDTLATYTEDEFPKNWQTLKLDLSAYAGQTVHIAFVHVTTHVSQDAFDISDSFGLDNLWVRPLQDAKLHEALVANEYPTPMAVSMTPELPFMYMNVRVIGDQGTVNISSLDFTSQGTLDPAQITEATLYYTWDRSLISVTDPTGYIIYGTATNVDGKFAFEGNLDLPVGNNYFWLAFTVNPNYTPTYPYPEVDVTFDGVTIDGTRSETTVNGFAATRRVVPSIPQNDNFANAIEITTPSGRYGASNVLAMPQPSIETLAYCAPGGVEDGSNSIWWHFKAPSDGWITADLSACAFNTILVFYNKKYDQVACNDNIDETEGILQSKISEYPVAKGEDVYIRVTGYGDPFAGPQNAASGVVILDFTFTVPLGIENNVGEDNLSNPFPNPANDKASFTLARRDAGEVTLQVRDLMGRLVLTERFDVASGEAQTVTLDVAALPAGTYVVSFEDNRTSTQKLIIAR